MIEQTELVVLEWKYNPPVNSIELTDEITHFITLKVQKKRALNKKGLACRFSCNFILGNETILEYTGEDSYVIDLEDIIDQHELLTMIKNSHTKFKEKFDFRKLGTILQDRTLDTLKENEIDLDPILPLLI